MSGSLSGGKKISCKEMPGEKIYLLAFDAGKNLTQLHVGEKNYFSRGLGKKKILSQTKSPIPLSKVKWSTPKQGARVKQRHFGGKT